MPAVTVRRVPIAPITPTPPAAGSAPSTGLGRRDLLALGLGLGALAGAPPLLAKPARVVRFVQPPDRLAGERWYPYQLLREALSASGEAFEISRREWLTSRRAERELADPHGVIDVYAMGGSLERERSLHLIPLPLHRGMYGWRLLLVRPDRLPGLPDVADLAALRQLLLIQSEDWPDTTILRHAGLRVLGGSTQMHRLHEALQAGQADAFPRGIPEAWRELDADPRHLAVLPGPVLQYRYDACFYCRRGDQPLISALGRGLAALQRSGRFDTLLRAQYGAAMARSQLAQRHVLHLANPLLPAVLDRLPAAAWTLPN